MPRRRPPKHEDKPANPADDAATTITKTVNEVNVVFTVTDKHGRYVRNLAKRDFSVIDDGKPADQIRSFHNETDLPLQVGLLVDASNSIRDRFKFEQESAVEFLNQTIRPRYDKAFVVGFDVTPGSDPGLHRQHGSALARSSGRSGQAAAPPCTMRCILPAATSC